MIEGRGFYVLKALWEANRYFVIRKITSVDRFTGEEYQDYRELKVAVAGKEVICMDVARLTRSEEMAVRVLHGKRKSIELF